MRDGALTSAGLTSGTLNSVSGVLFGLIAFCSFVLMAAEGVNGGRVCSCGGDGIFVVVVDVVVACVRKGFNLIYPSSI